MLSTYEFARMYQRRERSLLAYLRELKDEAAKEVAHEGSPVTSMAEDKQINEIGLEKLKIIRRILAILDTD